MLVRKVGRRGGKKGKGKSRPNQQWVSDFQQYRKPIRRIGLQEDALDDDILMKGVGHAKGKKE